MWLKVAEKNYRLKTSDEIWLESQSVYKKIY